MIKFDAIRKSYDGNTVLRDISFSVQPGEVIAVLGASGAGKSTIINCLNGLVVPDAGHIEIDGLSMRSREQHRALRLKCATVFQHFNLYPHMTVLQNITLAPMRVLGVNRAVAESSARSLLESVGLLGHLGKFPAQLSGGQKQRVGICRALAMSPAYLLLDEITSSLDPEMTGEVVAVLEKLLGDELGILMVTHEIGVARRLATRIMFLDEGKIIADVAKSQFFADAFLREQPRIASFVQANVGELQ